MAFTNYIAMSLICVLLFHGYGLGLYGELERWQCELIVPLIWAALLAWSKPWLAHHAYGPLDGRVDARAAADACAAEPDATM